MTALAVDDVSKNFGAVTAVDHVTFDLGEHELLALVGPSGCGKSTLLRMLAGLFRSDSGSITLAGAVVDDEHTVVPPERRRVGLVFQEHALFPHLTVAKNVGFGVRSGRAEAVAAQMLEVVGLAGFGDRYPHELSGGERQRVALARAMAPEPAIVLLDEPFASLDPNLRTRVRDDVVGILRSAGTPAVFVTHDQSEALAIGDRIAVMRAGAIVQLDTPAAVFHAPVNTFVAAFMGDADFVGVDVARQDLGLSAPADGDRSTLMVRPDDISLTRDEDGDATVVAAEFRGSSWCYEVRLPSGTTVHSLRSHIDPLEPGDRVSAALSPGHRPVFVEE